MIGLFRTIFIILLIYFIIRVISRYVVPFFLKGYVKNITSQMKQQQEEMLRQQKKGKEGDVTVNYTPQKEKNFGKEEGDYVDFEEIK